MSRRTSAPLVVSLPAMSPAILNRHGDDLFQIQDPLTGLYYSASFAWKCSPAKRLYAQMLFLQSDITGGYADDQNRIVVSSLSSARQELAYLRDLCEYWQSHHPDRALQSLSRLELLQMIRDLMIKKENNETGTQILGVSTLTMICKILDRTYTFSHSGKLVDGTVHRMTKSFKKLAMEPLLKKLDLDFDTWFKGGSYGSIPMTCASLMLAEAITLIESDEAAVATVFFEQWRTFQNNVRHWFADRDRLAHARRMELPDYVLTRWEREWAPSATALGTAVDAATKNRFEKLPWSSVGELADFCCELTKACLSIITLLSGFRLGETGGMKMSDYEQRPDGSWWFTSENTKTESGFAHPRSLHGLAAEAATLMKKLTPVNTDDIDLPLFHHSYRSSGYEIARGWGNNKDEWLADVGFDNSTLRFWFKDFYKVYVVEKYPEAGKMHSDVTPHQARHTFAEFALRRFDGNVLERIREHFRHAYGSFHTQRYTREKLSESVRLSMERDYAKEVIGRISLGQLDDRFYGPAAKRIEKEMADISILTPDELDERITEAAEELVRFTAFAWGFCVLRKGEQHLAKCHDPQTGTPNVDQHSSPNICLGCPHGMNNDLQSEELKLIGIAHTNIAKTHPLKAIGKLSEDVVAKVKRRLAGQDA
jgi:integrase